MQFDTPIAKGSLARGLAERPRLAVAGSFFVVAAIFMGVFALAERLERDRTASEFATASSARLRGVSYSIAADLTAMEFTAVDLRALVSTRVRTLPNYLQIISNQLQALSSQILKNERDLWIVACALRVSASERDAFEGRARLGIGTGFRLVEVAPGGGLRPAQAGEEHQPVVAMLSESHPGVLLGLDIASTPGIKEHLDAARDGGSVVATPPISMLAGTPESVWLVSALYRTPAVPGTVEERRAELEGYVVIGLRTDRLLDEPLAGQQDVGIDLLLADVTPGFERKILAADSARPRSGQMSLEEIDLAMSRASDREPAEIAVASRSWQIVAAAGPAFYAARRQWQAWAILAAGVLLAAVAAIMVRQALARRRLVEGVVAERTAELTREIEERSKVESQLRDAERALTTRLEDLDRRNTEISLLNQMGEMLQRCMTTAEALPVVRRFAGLLFPGDRGELYLHPEGADFIEQGTTWGAAGPESQVFPLSDCWALRSGKPYFAADPARDLVCPHVKSLAPGSVSLCVPLSAQGQIVGLLHLHGRSAAGIGSGEAAPVSARQDLAVTVAEQVSLAVSNIRLREILREQSIRDPLTGLYNRRYMEESINQTLHRAQRSGTPVGVIMIDIDHFKRFNDEHGHDAGDAVLRGLGGLLRGALRESDTACRYGGEEFVVIMPDASAEVAAGRAERVRAMAQGLRVSVGGATLGPITLSLGVAAYPSHGADRDGVLVAADRALYEAKAQGRDRVVIA